MERKNCREFSSLLQTLLDTAALVTYIDFVFSIDTSIAHLCGALGKPVYLLLHDNPDWRWGLDCSNSFWYENFRVIWQVLADDWGSVLKTLTEELSKNSER